MRLDKKRIIGHKGSRFVQTSLAVALVSALNVAIPEANAGAKIVIDDTRWISVGMGIRSSFNTQENGAANGRNWSNNFSIDNARLYFNGQVHENIKFEFNTDSFFSAAGNGPGGTGASIATFDILDAIGKFEFNRYINLWAGRMLVPSERGELNGPFYQSTYDAFKTPFNPADYSTGFGNNNGAGRYGRDNGVTLWGNVDPGLGQFAYVLGAFQGLRSSAGVGPNQANNTMWVGRFTWNLLNPENNPGYYTSGTYYGKAGDILAFAFSAQYQKDGAGSFSHRANFLGLNGDVLFEKVLPNNLGVFTFNGEYKQFYANYDPIAARAEGGCFCMFDGKSWNVTGLYLFPQKIGIGQFQPYGKFTSIQPNNSTNRNEIEGGVNYIIDGHNARISAFYQHGDLITKALNYAPGAQGHAYDMVKLAFQLQI